MSDGVRGRALVINVFKTRHAKWSCLTCTMSSVDEPREGSDLDHINMSRMLNDMGFTVAAEAKPTDSFSAQVEAQTLKIVM